MGKVRGTGTPGLARSSPPLSGRARLVDVCREQILELKEYDFRAVWRLGVRPVQCVFCARFRRLR